MEQGMKTREDKRKISVRMWAPLLQKLNDLCTEACLNRDAYLDVVLASEAEMLRTELAGHRNSDTARKYVKRCFLELPEHRAASLNVRVGTAEAIDQACDEVNVWRDVFINRIAYLLVVRTTLLEAQWDLKFEDYRDEIFEDGWEIKRLLLGPRLAAIGSFIHDDPFEGMRSALRTAYPDTKGALHLLPLGLPDAESRKGRGLVGFSTHLDDTSVPGTEANAQQRAWAEEMLEMLSEDAEAVKRDVRKKPQAKSTRKTTARHVRVTG